MRNSTLVSEFVLLGFTDNHRLELLLFFLLLSTYLLTIWGNTMIIVVTLRNHHLCTPMYFFLRHFAVLEIGFTTAVIPKALANIVMDRKTISFHGCFIEFFLYFFFGTTEFFLLAVMSIDRYVAICNPLHYATTMTDQICTLLVLCSWVGGLLLNIGPAILLFQMPFCGTNVIRHFFCDSGPLIKLGCADTTLLEFIDFLFATFCLLGTLLVNIMSYVKIISTITHIPSVTGKQKVFSTCASHITVVSITYGSCIVMYITPKGHSEIDFTKIVAIFNTVVAPLLNPFVYCLRNKQFQYALKDSFRQYTVSCRNPKWFGTGLKSVEQEN